MYNNWDKKLYIYIYIFSLNKKWYIRILYVTYFLAHACANESREPLNGREMTNIEVVIF